MREAALGRLVQALQSGGRVDAVGVRALLHREPREPGHLTALSVLVGRALQRDRPVPRQVGVGDRPLLVGGDPDQLARGIAAGRCRRLDRGVDGAPERPLDGPHPRMVGDPVGVADREEAGVPRPAGRLAGLLDQGQPVGELLLEPRALCLRRPPCRRHRRVADAGGPVRQGLDRVGGDRPLAPAHARERLLEGASGRPTRGGHPVVIDGDLLIASPVGAGKHVAPAIGLPRDRDPRLLRGL